MSGKIKEIIAGTGLLALAYFISRFLGLIREMVIAWRFGASELTDIYNASFLIPDILNYMLAGGAFSIVLIPMLSRYVTDGQKPRLDSRGQEIFAAIFTPVTLIIVALTIAALFLAPWFSGLLFPEFAGSPVKFQKLVWLTRIILPAQVFFIAGGIINATLRARGDFRGNLWGPNIYNLGIILGGALLGGFWGIAGLSVGVLLGAVAGPFLVCYLFAQNTLKYSFSLNFRSADFKEYIRLNLPLMLGFSLLTVDQFFIRFFGARSGIAEGTITCLNYSRTVMLLPIALIGQSTGQVSLTYLSQLWQKGKRAEFNQTFDQTLRGVMFLAFVFTGALFVLVGPLTTLLFYRGAFTLENSHYTADLFQYMVFAVPAFATLQVLLNGYYARKNTLRPMVLSSLTTIVSYFVYRYFQARLAGQGIALATAICFWLVFVVMFLDYYFKFGKREGFALRSVLATTARGALAVLPAILLLHFTLTPPGWLPLNADRKLEAVLLIAILGAVYLALVSIATWLLGGDEAAILKKIFHKLKKLIHR